MLRGLSRLWGGFSHFPEPTVVFCQTRPERTVLGVFYAEFTARLLDDLRHSGVVYVADRGEEMMLEMEVQASEEPRPDPAVPVVIERHLGLVHSPWVLHLMRGFVG